MRNSNILTVMCKKRDNEKITKELGVSFVDLMDMNINIEQSIKLKELLNIKSYDYLLH